MITSKEHSAPGWIALFALAVLFAPSCSDDARSSAGGDASPDVSLDRSRDVPNDFAAPDMVEETDDIDVAVDNGGEDAVADARLDVDDVDDDANSDPVDTPGEDQADGGSGCDAAVTTLAAELYEQIGACTVTVRLDYQSYAPLGYAVLCGRYGAVDESSARATAQADSGYGDFGSMLNAASPDDYFVFYQAPSDFGGAAAVSAQTGLTSFGGSIIWLGTGEITYPSTWRDAAELADGCSESGGVPASRGWDLRGGSALGAGDVSAALDVVLRTAVPGAFWQGGYVFDAVVLLYPRSMGVFDPGTAEWIVMVSGGWLE